MMNEIDNLHREENTPGGERNLAAEVLDGLQALSATMRKACVSEPTTLLMANIFNSSRAKDSAEPKDARSSAMVANLESRPCVIEEFKPQVGINRDKDGRITSIEQPGRTLEIETRDGKYYLKNTPAKVDIDSKGNVTVHEIVPGAAPSYCRRIEYRADGTTLESLPGGPSREYDRENRLTKVESEGCTRIIKRGLDGEINEVYDRRDHEWHDVFSRSKSSKPNEGKVAVNKSTGEVTITEGRQKTIVAMDGSKTMQLSGRNGIERETTFDRFGHISELKRGDTRYSYKWEGDKLKQITSDKGGRIVADGDSISLCDAKGENKLELLKGKISSGKGDIAFSVTTANEEINVKVDGSCEIARKEGGCVCLDRHGQPTRVVDAAGNEYEFKNGIATNYSNKRGKFERVGTDKNGYDIYRAVGNSAMSDFAEHHLKITARANGMVSVTFPETVTYKHTEIKQDSAWLSMLGAVKLKKDATETTHTVDLAVTMSFGLDGQLMPANNVFGNCKLADFAEGEGFIAHVKKPGDLLLVNAGNKADAFAVVAAKLLAHQDPDGHDWFNFGAKLLGGSGLDTYSYSTVQDVKSYVRNFQLDKDGPELVEDSALALVPGGASKTTSGPGPLARAVAPLFKGW